LSLKETILLPLGSIMDMELKIYAFQASKLDASEYIYFMYYLLYQSKYRPGPAGQRSEKKNLNVNTII
jgi:hypothetical protein